MNNKEIAAAFDLLSKIMALHQENPFKIKAYQTAAFRIKKIAQPLSDTDLNHLSVPGIGEAILKKIQTLLQTGELPLLNQYMEKTPEGVVEMLQIKGLGAKKVRLLWKQLDIQSVGELAYACEENRLVSLNGFGAKTQAAILENIHFLQAHKGLFLYADVAQEATDLLTELKTAFPKYNWSFTGDFRRQLPVLDSIAFAGDVPFPELKEWLELKGLPIQEANPEGISVKIAHLPTIQFHLSTKTNTFPILLFRTTNPPAFTEAFLKENKLPSSPQSENDIFSTNDMSFIPPALRESANMLRQAKNKTLPNLIGTEDIRGVIHCHSTYSDGLNSLEEMALGAIERGFEYLTISDHSQSAGYANGLKPDRVIQQHEAIDRLNKQLQPFHIFKGIESDILSDGSLDYEDEVLASFDLIIASVHSNLKMTEEKAMQRLIKAVENPYTRILGHPTGRLLLSRKGYPVEHKKLIDACAANGVSVEINAQPRRLDLDWQWIPYALEKGVLLAIDPDAHSVSGMDLVKYGVLVAQKGGLPASKNLSSLSLPEFQKWLQR